MAKKRIYHGDLLKTDDWGGPIVKDGVIYDGADGASVQNFIKSTLNNKWGYIHDTNKGKYYIFADEESCLIYLEHEDDDPMDPEIAALKLAELNSYSDYRIVITLDSEHTLPTNAILLGQTGNEVVFRADTFDNDDNPLLEAININYTITRPDGSKTYITHIIQSGESDKLTVDNYIVEGQNTVAINAVGTTSNAVTNTVVVYQVINLQVKDNIDISDMHDISDGKSDTLSIKWDITGSSTVNKFIEWYIDGVMQPTPSPIPGGQDRGSITHTIEINSNSYSEGRHNIQYRAWLVIDEKKFYTPTYYRDFIVYGGGESPIIAVALTIPIGHEPFIGDSYLTPVLYDVVQYTSFNLPVAVFKNNVANINTTIQVVYVDASTGEHVDVSYTNAVENYVVWNSTITPTIDGDSTIRITADDGMTAPVVYEISSDIEENELDVHEITAGLILNLRANGKNNTSPDKDVWEYQNGPITYSTTFENFTWDDNSGWNNDELVISNGNAIEINCKPLTRAVASDGLTFEIEFSTFNVADDDALVCQIKDDTPNAPGITITASEAIFSDSARNTVSTKFKSNENNRIAFVVDPASAAKPLIYIYVNGAACGAAGYGSTSEFAADKFIRIAGTSQVEIKLRHIRIYNTALDANQILNNYMLYRNTFSEMKEIYDRNDIVTNEGKFNMDAISSILPVLLITDYDNSEGSINNITALMNFTSKDKKTPILLRRIQYINNLDPTTNFITEYPQMTCQGTSSMNYPKKNLRLYLKDKKAKPREGDVDFTLPVTYYETSSTIDNFNPESDRHSNPGKGKISFKSGLPGTFSEGERKPQAVNCWTFKADYAESSSSHNTGVGRLWNQVMRDAILGDKYVSRTRAQAVVMSDTSNKMDVRTTVDGFPCVVFYRYALDDIDWKFLGKYNFNNDKSTESVFGFCDIDGIEYQEYEYQDITEEEFNEASATTPGDCSASTFNYTKIEDMEQAVRNKVGKDETEELTHDDYVATFCPTPYEYSKIFQKSTVFVAGEVNMVLFEEKIMTSSPSSLNNKNYCVEVLENENTVTNFIADVSEFDANWEHAFEFRYPEVDKDIPDADTRGGLTNLREFYVWCHSTMETQNAFIPGMTITISGETKHDEDLVYKQANQYYGANGDYVVNTYEDFLHYQKLKFEKEKWDYLDVFKIAAYYVYLMRFGAVDQVVKNSMFTTEGTIAYVAKTTSSSSDVTVTYDESIGNHCKWFYINYDNDTILGLNNDGQLVYNPDIDRQTRTGTGTWIEYAEPTQEQIDACIGTYDTLDDLLHAVEIGEITPESGDMYLVGEEVYEWSNESGYAYAGHSSVLWNNLEADDEFMTIVSEIDNSIYLAGLTYDKTLRMFNVKQANMWCERILNKDADFKYIQPYTLESLNHLGKMQGPRSSHRAWWLSKRFTYYDSKFVSGEYKNKMVLFKADMPVQHGTDQMKFTILPTELMNYGWGISARANGQTGIPSTKDPSGKFNYITFDLADGGMVGLAPGDPVEIYATPYISELDLSNFAPYLMMLNMTGIQHEVLGSQLRRLILGKEGKVNTGASSLKPDDLTGIEKAEKLEYIDIQGFESLSNLDLSQNPNVKEVYAPRSGLLAITFANGSRMERVTLPVGYKTLILDGVNFLTKQNIVFERDMSNVTNLQVINCDALKETSFDLLNTWYNDRNGDFANCTLRFEGFDWSIRYSDIDVIETLQNICGIELRGTITILDDIQGGSRDETIQRVNRIKRIFGENCFDLSKNPPVYVTCKVPFIIINADKTEVTARIDTVVNYTCEIYPFRVEVNPPEITESVVYYEIVSGEGYETRSGVTMTSDSEHAIGTLTTEELVTGRNNNLTIRVTYWYTGSNQFTSEINLLVKDPTYPRNQNMLKINGVKSIKKEQTNLYVLDVLDYQGKEASGTYYVTWSFSDYESRFIDYDHSGPDDNPNHFVVVTNDEEPTGSSQISLNVTVAPYNGNAVSNSMELLILNEDVIMSTESNPVVMRIAKAQGWAPQDENVLTRSEAQAVVSIGNAFEDYVSSAFTFDEFSEFIGVTSIDSRAFANCAITRITIPSSISVIGDGAFMSCGGLTEINFAGNNVGLTTIPEHCFDGCQSLSKIALPDTITTIKKHAFGNTANILNLVVKGTNIEKNVLAVPNTLSTIEDGAFETESTTLVNGAIVYDINEDCKLQYVEIPKGIGINKLDRYMLRGEYISAFTVNPENTQYVDDDGILFNRSRQTIYKYPCGKNGSTIYTLPNDTFTLYSHCFYNTKLEHIIFNGIVRDFGTNVFASSQYLADVDMSLSTSLVEIGDYAYTDCVSLTGVTYPNSIKRFGTHIYENCPSLTVIPIPSTTEGVGKYFINNCPNVEYLELPDTLTGVTGGAADFLNNCRSLKDIKFPKYLTLQRNCANGMTSLTGVTLPVGSYTRGDNVSVVVNTAYNERYLLGDETLNANKLVEYRLPDGDDGKKYEIYDSSIYSVSNKQLINVPSGKVSLTMKPGALSVIGVNSVSVLQDGGGAVAGCIFLTGITFSDTLSSAGKFAFANCSSLTQLSLPESLVTMEDSCFKGCTSLSSITFGTGVTNIRPELLSDCTNLKNVVFKSSSLAGALGYAGFLNCSNLSSITMSYTSVPTISGENVLRGLNPFGQVDKYPQYSGSFPLTRQPSTFVGYNTRNDGVNVIKVAYFTDGLGTTSLDLYKNAAFWGDPLFTAGDSVDPDLGCGFDIEYLTFADTLYVKLYSGGSAYEYAGVDTTQIPYAHPQVSQSSTSMGVYHDSGDFEGYYEFSFAQNLVSNEPIIITKGESGDAFGTIYPQAFEEHTYELENSFSATRGSAHLMSSAPSNDGEQVVTKYDYDLLVSKLNALDTKFRKFLEN